MKLRLKGFKGIKAGPELTWDGLDEIAVDFTGKSGLVAFDGQNGAGKSTLLENLHHYPQLVSRDGALWQHVIGRSAEKEFESEFMGHHYRSLIKMDADQGKQEGYLWIDGNPSVNGKITAYKELINSIFGQPFTYFRSQFCPQKSKATKDMQIETMTTGVFRELLRYFLNLERYAAWEDIAKQAGNIYTGQVGQLDNKITALLNIINAGTTTIIDEGDLSRQVGQLNNEKLELSDALIEKRGQIDTLKEIINKNILALQRKADIQKQIDGLTADLAKEKDAAATEINSLALKYTNIKTELSGKLAFLLERGKIEAAADRQRDLENSLVVLQSAIDRLTGEQSENQGKIHVIETELAALRQSLKTLETDPENLRLGKIIEEAERNIAEKERQLRELALDYKLLALQAEISSLEKAALVGDGIDATCQSVTCAAIKSVNEARERLPVVINSLAVRKSEIGKKEDQFIEEIKAIKADTDETISQKEKRIAWIKQWNQDATEEIFAKESALASAKRDAAAIVEQLTANRQNLAMNRAEILKQKALADRLPEIQIAEARKADLEKQLKEITEQGTAKKLAWQEKEKASEGAMSELRFNIRHIEMQFDEKAETALQAVQWDIKEIETVKLPGLDKEIQAARDKIAALQAELTKIDAAEKELAEIRSQKDALSRNISAWKYIQIGCGKTGLQNLRIDAAAPHIVLNANRLLSQAYGALYSIRLETMNEQGKEDLNIKIIMENGQEVYLDDISGGQRTWTTQALWLAMSLLNQEKSGKSFTYFCADESDGALDPANAENFTALYRPFMAESHLDSLCFISHKPNCRSMADHTLLFEHGANPKWQ